MTGVLSLSLTDFQCSIPVFDGLLPEPFNDIVLTLLYQTAKWHALAKLRVHSESTLNHLEVQTKILGQQMRAFRDTTKDTFSTVELPSETAARKRRSLATKGNVTAQPRGPLKKVLNLHTYKFHALGDYIQSIRLFGTIDSYSTQLVCTSQTFIHAAEHSFPPRVNLRTGLSNVYSHSRTRRMRSLKSQPSTAAKLVQARRRLRELTIS